MSHTKWLLLPEEGAYINFQNLKRLAKAAFIIYGDFECVLVPSTDNVDICKKYQDHVSAVMATDYFVLMNGIINHAMLNFVRMLLTNF